MVQPAGDQQQRLPLGQPVAAAPGAAEGGIAAQGGEIEGVGQDPAPGLEPQAPQLLHLLAAGAMQGGCPLQQGPLPQQEIGPFLPPAPAQSVGPQGPAQAVHHRHPGPVGGPLHRQAQRLPHGAEMEEFGAGEMEGKGRLKGTGADRARGPVHRVAHHPHPLLPHRHPQLFGRPVRQARIGGDHLHLSPGRRQALAQPRHTQHRPAELPGGGIDRQEMEQPHRQRAGCTTVPRARLRLCLRSKHR